MTSPGEFRAMADLPFNLADERLFCSIEEAGSVMVELMTKRLPQLRVTNETARLAKATRTSAVVMRVFENSSNVEREGFPVT